MRSVCPIIPLYGGRDIPIYTIYGISPHPHDIWPYPLILMIYDLFQEVRNLGFWGSKTPISRCPEISIPLRMAAMQ